MAIYSSECIPDLSIHSPCYVDGNRAVMISVKINIAYNLPDTWIIMNIMPIYITKVGSVKGMTSCSTIEYTRFAFIRNGKCLSRRNPALCISTHAH